MKVVRNCLTVFALLFLGIVPLFGQTPVSVQNNDHPCELSIDGRAMGTFAAGASKSISVQPGSHFFVCMNSSIAKANDKRQILLDSSVTLQVSGANPLTVQLPRLSVEAKNTTGASAKVAATADLMSERCAQSSTKGAALGEAVSIAEGAIRSCNGVGAYLLVRSRRGRFLAPLQDVKLLVPGKNDTEQDVLFEIRPDQ